MKKEAGISLLEVLFTAMVLVILAVPIIYGLQRTLKLFTKANNTTTAVYLGEDLLFEEIIQPDKLEDKGEFPSPFNYYSWEIKREPDPDHPEFIKATIIVKNTYGREKYVFLSTFTKEKE